MSKYVQFHSCPFGIQHTLCGSSQSFSQVFLLLGSYFQTSYAKSLAFINSNKLEKKLLCIFVRVTLQKALLHLLHFCVQIPTLQSVGIYSLPRFSSDVKMPISRCSRGSIQPELQHVQNANGIMMPILPTNLL